jgi:serine/threonine-protein kinase
VEKDTIETDLTEDSDTLDEFLQDVARISGAKAAVSALGLGAQLQEGQLEIVGRLGEGGMGIVHVAMDRSMDRQVALKELAAHLANSERGRVEFVNEARVTGQLQHPNVVPVHALAEGPSGTPYFTMQVIDGCTLADWLDDAERKPASRERIEGGIEILLRVCDALSFAHSRGILHRDVKPGNIMVGAHGRVYLMDWGLAMPQSEAARGGHRVSGTPAYMAPEQAGGGSFDERVDIFGLGAVLYEIVSGRTPYDPTEDERGRGGSAGVVGAR